MLALSLAGACRKGQRNEEGTGKPGGSAAPIASGLDSELVRSVVNPGNVAPYAGPTGTLAGTVRIEGDPAPERPEVMGKIPEKCAVARSMYEPLFREGDERRLADALVTVTGYEPNFVPARTSVVRVVARDCMYNTRTIALTFGQGIEVIAQGSLTYLPDLVGARRPAQLAAIPGKAPIRLLPKHPGQFALVDGLYFHMVADVLVLKYPTFSVTGRDGKYEITGIPTGEVTVNALLPVATLVAEARATIRPGKTTELDLTLRFDQAKYEQVKRRPTPGAAPSAASAATSAEPG